MSKRALLIGINHFADPAAELRGCVNDTREVRDLLTTFFGFPPDEIRVLHDSEATDAAIRRGLDWLASDYQGMGQDVRFLHCSTHGAQVEDEADDEWDCLDECLVTHDHDWDRPLRDDDLRKLFESIPEDVNFTFLADCCHSGSIQRGEEEKLAEYDIRPRFLQAPREVTQRIAQKRAARDADPRGWIRQALKTFPQEQWDRKLREFTEQARKQRGDSPDSNNKFAMVPVDRHVLLAGCRAEQTAADARLGGEYRGAFSWALGRVIQKADGRLSYQELITRVGELLQDFDQCPQLECPVEMRKRDVLGPLGAGR